MTSNATDIVAKAVNITAEKHQSQAVYITAGTHKAVDITAHIKGVF